MNCEGILKIIFDAHWEFCNNGQKKQEHTVIQNSLSFHRQIRKSPDGRPIKRNIKRWINLYSGEKINQSHSKSYFGVKTNSFYIIYHFLYI